MNFWQTLTKPIIGMSPMDGVTDNAFRSILAKHGKPSVIFTEFVHVMALWHGKINVFETVNYNSLQRPIVAQIFGTEPNYFYKAAHIIAELGFDGVDINMGCPANTIVRRGGGAQLIKTPKLAQEIILQTKKGIADWTKGQTLENLKLKKEKIDYIKKIKKEVSNKFSNKQIIPVSVKTRLGYDNNIIQEWSDTLIEAKPAAITVHGRTLQQQYTGEADWDAIGSVSEKVRQSGIVYLGNGDVKDLADSKAKCDQYGLDGVLIGRAALGNPWIFSSKTDVSLNERFNVLLEHARIFTQNTKPIQFPAIKKHLGWYCTGFQGAKQLRIKLMECKNYYEIEDIILSF